MWTKLPPEKKAHPPHQFLAHVYCGQMAGWMKMPLGTEIDLGPGNIVLDGVPAAAKGALQPPLFGPCLLWPRRPSQLLLSSCSYCFDRSHEARRLKKAAFCFLMSENELLSLTS